MKYTKGSIGRVFLVKFDDGDVFLEKIIGLAKKEHIKTATMVFLGAFKKGYLVTGPKKPVIPPEPNKAVFKDGWEALGVGTIFTPRQKAQPVKAGMNGVGSGFAQANLAIKDATAVKLWNFTNQKGPQIHIHTGMGKRHKTLIGCVRGKTEVFLVVEAVIFELKGIKATKSIDPETGINLLKILDGV